MSRYCQRRPLVRLCVVIKATNPEAQTSRIWWNTRLQMLRDVYKLTKTFVYYLQAKFTHREAIYEERKIKAERERE